MNLTIWLYAVSEELIWIMKNMIKISIKYLFRN